MALIFLCPLKDLLEVICNYYGMFLIVNYLFIFSIPFGLVPFRYSSFLKQLSDASRFIEACFQIHMYSERFFMSNRDLFLESFINLILVKSVCFFVFSFVLFLFVLCFFIVFLLFIFLLFIFFIFFNFEL